MQTPNDDIYRFFQRAFRHFNRNLFNGDLPECVIAVRRTRGASGYFASKRWVGKGRAVADEISLDPVRFKGNTTERILSTLVHEMCHQWQAHFGKPSRNGYHNKQWAQKMCEVGLIPSSTGHPKGKQTGQSMSHYIEENGPFAKSCRRHLRTGATINWSDRWELPAGRDTSKRVKYSCRECGLNAWAKPKAKLVCGLCLTPMKSGFEGRIVKATVRRRSNAIPIE